MKKLMLALALAGLSLPIIANDEDTTLEERDVILLEVAVDTELGTVDVLAEVIPSADLAAAANEASDVTTSGADASTDVASDASADATISA